jgi:hypothetical protein
MRFHSLMLCARVAVALAASTIATARRTAAAAVAVPVTAIKAGRLVDAGFVM